MAGLIGVLTWLGLRLVKEHDRVVITTESNKEQIVIATFTLQAHAKQLEELRATNLKIVEQLEKIREELRGRPRVVPPRQLP